MNRGDFSAIPVLDLRRADRGGAALQALARDLRRAAIEVGFFTLTGHGVPRATIDAVFETAHAFFALPLAEKQAVTVDARHRGFLRVGEATMAGAERPDLKESFLFGIDLPESDPDVAAGKKLMGPNRWPQAMPAMKIAADRYMAAIEACGQKLLRVFAVALDLPEDHFQPCFAKPLARGSLLYYPPQPPELGPDQYGVSPHTDYGALTFVSQDDTGGLQIRNRAGAWVAAPPDRDAFVVNIGDLMARWTNDLFVSTPHRVVNATTRPRFSVAVFYDPHFDTEIAAIPSCVPAGTAPLYPATTCGDYILSRFGASFAYRQAAPPHVQHAKETTE
jgi:isopenicillin N synthase-like dioxygenase